MRLVISLLSAFPFLYISAATSLSEYLVDCHEKRRDPDPVSLERFPEPKKYQNVKQTKTALKQIYMQRRPHAVFFELFWHWKFFYWSSQDYIDVIKAGALDALRMMLSFPQGNLYRKHELIQVSLECYEDNPAIQVQIIEMLVMAGVKATENEVCFASENGLNGVQEILANQIPSDLDLATFFEYSVDKACKNMNLYEEKLTVENSLLPAMKVDNDFNLNCLLKEDRFNAAYYNQIIKSGVPSTSGKFSMTVGRRILSAYKKFKGYLSPEILAALLNNNKLLGSMVVSGLCLDLDKTSSIGFIAAYLIKWRNFDSLVRMLNGRPLTEQIVGEIWRALLDETGKMTMLKLVKLITFLEKASSTDLTTLPFFYDLIFQTMVDPAKSLAILMKKSILGISSYLLPPQFIENNPSLSESQRAQLITAMTKYSSSSDSAYAVMQLDPKSFYSEAIFFAKSSIIREMMDSTVSWNQTETMLSPRAMEYFKQVILETSDIKVGDIFPEERFWVNCLLDNYIFAHEDKNSYSGSVELEQEGYSIKRLLFPSYNMYFESHLSTVKHRMTFNGPDEIFKFSLFESYVSNIVESGQRFLNGAITPEHVKGRIANLKPGESYALDVYQKDEKLIRKQGHLVIGIVSRSENDSEAYNVDIINTGLQAPTLEYLRHRIIIKDRMINIPQQILLDKYIPIIPSGEIVNKSFKPANEAKKDYLDAQGRPTEYFISDTIRSQRSGTCSIKRIWAMAKITLGLDLYMEFKTNFILSFVESLSRNFDRLVREEWTSPRPSIWMRIIALPFLEKGLLRQLRRLPADSERYLRLSALIITSVKQRHDHNGIRYLLR